jgi:hypothetical protein
MEAPLLPETGFGLGRRILRVSQFTQLFRHDVGARASLRLPSGTGSRACRPKGARIFGVSHVSRFSRRGIYPPAIAPITINGSFPETTASGSGASGNSWERSSSQANSSAHVGTAALGRPGQAKLGSLLPVVVADGSGAPYLAGFARCGLDHGITRLILDTTRPAPTAA